MPVFLLTFLTLAPFVIPAAVVATLLIVRTRRDRRRLARFAHSERQVQTWHPDAHVQPQPPDRRSS